MFKRLALVVLVTAPVVQTLALVPRIDSPSNSANSINAPTIRMASSTPSEGDRASSPSATRSRAWTFARKRQTVHDDAQIETDGGANGKKHTEGAGGLPGEDDVWDELVSKAFDELSKGRNKMLLTKKQEQALNKVKLKVLEEERKRQRMAGRLKTKSAEIVTGGGNARDGGLPRGEEEAGEEGGGRRKTRLEWLVLGIDW